MSLFENLCIFRLEGTENVISSKQFGIFEWSIFAVCFVETICFSYCACYFHRQHLLASWIALMIVYNNFSDKNIVAGWVQLRHQWLLSAGTMFSILHWIDTKSFCVQNEISCYKKNLAGLMDLPKISLNFFADFSMRWKIAFLSL